MHALPPNLPELTAECLARLRAQTPRVHCVTNTVAQAFTANILLAASAVPSMTIAPDEIGGFVAGADALLINLGTLDAQRHRAIEIAFMAAKERNVPWVLDPTFVERDASRALFARALAERNPNAIRLNRAELTALAGIVTPTDKEQLRDYARTHDAAIGLTGQVDWVADATRIANIANGHALMARVTAMGCAASALVAAFLAVEKDAWQATVAALLAFGIAGEIAGERARGPGSFSVELLDALYALERETILARAKVS